MASTYALPASAMTHSHSHHGHAHSHSHQHAHSHSSSPSRLAASTAYPGNNGKSLRSEASNNSLHGASQTENNPRSPLQQLESNRASFDANATFANAYSDGLPPSWENHIHDHKHSGSNGSRPSSMLSIQEHDHDHGHGHENEHEHDHDHDHIHDHSHCHDHGYDHGHSHAHTETRSKFTTFLLQYAEGSPLLNSILLSKDSRRIFYFMSLNFAFMMIQAFYGIITDSLGLLSDSIHMFFDCLALAMGLFAAVASRWPASLRFPYGFGKIESLSGFGNGVFLMLISVEIVIEAIERLAEGRETKRLNELFVVSTLGLLVNLVGMASFGHHHHGHDHSHGSHDHSHSHSHGHEHSHHASADASPLSPAAIAAGTPSHNHSHSHGHSHDNENMHGIFLHVLADTMGSAAVIVSTLLMKYTGWYGWDPLASCIIAVLIFLSAIPLVKSSAKNLLLTIPADTEYQLRNTLSEVSGLRGVASYSVPRFWAGSEGGDGKAQQILGVMHVIATRGADAEDVRRRTRALLADHGMDVVVQVDKEGEGRCWCNGDASGRSPTKFT